MARVVIAPHLTLLMLLCLLGAGKKEVWLEAVTPPEDVPSKAKRSGQGLKKHQRASKRARQGQGDGGGSAQAAAGTGDAVVELSSDDDFV